MKIKIVHDVFDIASRIKELNENYEIYFDTNLQKFVVYAFDEYQMTIPYDELDVRTLDLVFDSRKENAEEIIKEIDKQNAKIDYDDKKQVKDEIENELTHRLRLARI